MSKKKKSKDSNKLKYSPNELVELGFVKLTEQINLLTEGLQEEADKIPEDEQLEKVLGPLQYGLLLAVVKSYYEAGCDRGSLLDYLVDAFEHVETADMEQHLESCPDCPTSDTDDSEPVVAPKKTNPKDLN